MCYMMRMQNSLRGLILAYIFRILEEVEALKAIMMDEVKVITGDGYVMTRPHSFMFIIHKFFYFIHSYS